VKGGAIPEGYYVQVRYPQGHRWVTVALSEGRRDAASLAADAYRHRPDARGFPPVGVRLVSATNLRGEDGLAVAIRAAGDILRGRGSPFPYVHDPE
jgi:hypothetical protein